jgi:diguanylate cyclase (GGDEF)-like protein
VRKLEVPELKLEEIGEQRKGAFKEKEAELTETFNNDQVNYSDITEAAKEVVAIYEISQTLGSTLHLSELLSVISSKIKRIVNYKTCVVYLYDAKEDTIHAAHAAGDNEGIFSSRVLKPGQGITGWAIANGDKVVNESPFLDLAGFSKDIERAYSNAVVLPLQIKGDTLGALTLYTAGAAFDTNQVRILETVASHASKAIQNSLVFKKTQEHALTDNLTGLHNFRYLYALFRRVKEEALAKDKKIGFLFMDLDDFKIVNDRYGHKVGDEMLQNITRVLRGQIREIDTLIRYGGDEFIALLNNITEDEADDRIERLERAVEDYVFVLDSGAQINLEISIGRSFYPDSGRTIEDLLVQADNDMYLKKGEKNSRKSAQLDNLIQYPVKKYEVS